MRAQQPQKSIEDYRNAVKLLKLKCQKLQKQNEDLIEKLRQQGITEETETTTQIDNQSVMIQFSRSCKRLGLTPEMMYRAADVQGQGQIESEQFRLFLNKIRLGMNNPQLQLLYRIFDDDCQGVIRREDYYDTLQVYGINEEKQPGQARTYGQESLIKYAKLLISRGKGPEKSYEELAGDKNIPPNLEQFKRYIKKIDESFGSSLNEKEMTATFNHLDYQKSGQLQRNFYEQEVRKAMKAASGDISTGFRKTQTNLAPPQNEYTYQTTNIPKGQDTTKKILLSPGQNKEPAANLTQSIMNPDNDKSIIVSQEQRGKATNILQRLRTLQCDGMEIIRKVVDNLEKPQAGVMLNDVLDAFKGTKVPKADQVLFFQALDLNENGSIDFDELMVFFQEFKGPHEKYDLLFLIIARQLQALNLSIDQYLASEQIYENTALDLESFHSVAKYLFNTTNQKQSEALYRYLDVDGSNELKASELINEITKITDKYVPREQPLMFESTLMKNSLKNVDKYTQDIIALKPSFSEDDYFSKYKMEGDDGSLHVVSDEKWQTIFTNELACIRFVYEEVQRISQSGDPNKKWDDPEFGPTDKDEFGSKSMYIADNDIPEGAPDPKECKWLRPEEVLAIQAELNDDLRGKQVDVFDVEGAEADDVKQSKYLGNCWFISALSIISGYEKYLQGDFKFTPETIQQIDDQEVQGMRMGVYPPCFSFLRKYGIYVFRFFKEFGWKYVVIDDKLCVKDNEYIYAHCNQPTEVWVNLIEKAYAKLHQNYFALTSGDIAQGLSDLCGKVPDKLKLEENMDKDKKEELWKRLIDSQAQGTMLGCSAEGETELFIQVNGEDSGIMSGHAYGILNVFEIPDPKSKNYHKSHRLLVIKNPWGYGEWKLKWSENPDYIQKFEDNWDKIEQYYDKAIEDAINKGNDPPERYKRGVDDGTFIMCYKSWRTIFSNLFVCIDFPDNWSGRRGFDRFGNRASGAPTKSQASLLAYAQGNPQYIIQVLKKTEVYIQMQQTDGRLFWGEKYPYPNVMKPILLCLFKLGDNEECLKQYDPNKLLFTSGKFNLRREIDLEFQTLEKGKYALIPCTKDPGCDINFTITVYYDCPDQEIKLSKYSDKRFKFEVVAEEDESTGAADERLRNILKKQAEEVVKAMG